MKKLLIILLIIALVVLFGTWPLTILSKIWDAMLWLGGIIGKGIKWSAKALDWFDWNGLLN